MAVRIMVSLISGVRNGWELGSFYEHRALFLVLPCGTLPPSIPLIYVPACVFFVGNRRERGGGLVRS